MFAVIALGVSFTACNNDDIQGPDGDGKANTHVSVALRMSAESGPSTYSTSDYNPVGDWAGKDKIEKITIYLVDGTSVNSKTLDVGSGKAYEVSKVGNVVNIIPKTVDAAIKTTAGMKKVYVLVNAADEVVAHLNKIPVAEFEDAYERVALQLKNVGSETVSETSASKLAEVVGAADAREDVITMTNVVAGTLDVKSNISASETIGASIGEAAKNRVSIQVERAVARVMVTIANQDSFTVPVNGETDQTPLGIISNITWVVAQGENSLYVQRNTSAIWETTPNYTWKPASDNNYWNEAGDKYDYSGLFEARNTHFGGTVVPKKGYYVDKDNVTVEEIEAGFLDGKFLLPTTHAYGVKDASQYKKGNTAYVLVRAQFSPSDAAYADGTKDYKAGDNFYVGANGKFYSSTANAVNPEKGGVVGQSVAKYVGGKVLYYAWPNPDYVPEWYNSPVGRNNIYHVHITGFKNLGTNWNPLFPEEPMVPYTPNEKYDPTDPEYVPWEPGENEPFLPNEGFDPKEPITEDNFPYYPNEDYKPELPTKPGQGSPVEGNEDYVPPVNPDPKPTPDPIIPEDGGAPIIPEEPTNPIDPTDPLTTPETWMSVDVTVLPWLVHSYEVDLGI